MQMKRQTEKQLRNKISEFNLNRELTNPNMEKSKSTRQSTIPGYVNKVRQNLKRQQERDKALKIKKLKT